MVNFIIRIDTKKLKKYKIYYDSVGDLPLIKGFYEPNKDKIYINLSSIPFLMHYYLEGYDTFVDELTKTITHEVIHQEINKLNLKTNSKYNEEWVCKTLAGQDTN